VIEINNILKEPLPIIVGLNLEGFSLGKPLYEEDLPFWDTVITLSNLFSNYPITDKFVYINVSNEDDIHIFIDKIDVWFGNIYNSYEKILRLHGIMETLADKNLSGYLDIRDIDQPPVFTQVS
jgi:hypothetical protein